jgi:protein TonB
MRNDHTEPDLVRPESVKPEPAKPDLVRPESVPDTTWEMLTQESSSDHRAMRIGLSIAVAIHMVLLAANFPELTKAEPPKPPDKHEAYVIQEVRFKPPPPPPKEEPPPPPKEEPPPKPKAKKVPVPDRTPEEPEPVVVPPPEPEPMIVPERITPVKAPPIEMPTFEVEIPAPPAPPPPPPEPTGPIRVGGDVLAPVKVSAPDPVYTETARTARIEGTVILEAVIDKNGNVDRVKVLKGLPMGLDRAAVDAVKRWKFEPGTHQGKPVDVIYNLTVHFKIQ